MKSPLFYSNADRLACDDRLSRRLVKSLESVRNGKASPTLDVNAFERALASKDFSSPEEFEPLLEWTIRHMETGAVQMTHPRYFGLFNPSPTFPSECADRIAAALNPQICVLSHAPVAVLIERHVIEKLGERIGFRVRSGGHFTSGGSEANATAVDCALTRVHPDFAERGCRALSGQPRIYVSKESHLAWLKIAHTSGMGRCAVRMVDTNGKGQMCGDALRLQMERDVASGDVPIMIAATVGTTNAGMIDPVESCAELAKEFNAWLHVDAAWGGALVADQTQASILGPIGLADSVTIDAHKWFASTMGTGMFLTPHIDVLESTFHAKASYMPSSDAQVDYYLTSLQWSRRFIGLRLFLALAAGGWEAFGAHVQHGQRLIERLNSKMIDQGWTVKNESALAVTCLLPPVSRGGRSAVESIVERIVAKGDAWVSVAILEGKPVIRVCITNGNTQVTDIDRLVIELNGACED